MVIGSWDKLEIGKEYSGLVDRECNKHPAQRYVVLNHSTYEDWLEENPVGHDIPIAKKQNFYLISTD